MNEPEQQGQHRISQVYLKQFGYNKNNNWWISVYQKGKESTDNILIDKFTKETNIFDLPFNDFKLKRHFENTSNLIENHYRTVISNLHNQKRLTYKDKVVLSNFVPNLLCRSKPFRMFIDSILRSKKTRDKFLNEITLFKGDREETIELLSLFKIDFQLNVAICVLMNHLVTILRQFKQVIIKDCENKGWLTTDNPVYIDRQEFNEWIIPFEAEIYFPLSRNFCLFMFHEQSEIKNNPLRKLKLDKINKIDFSTFSSITKNIVLNLDEFLIHPIEIENTVITDIN